MINNVLKVIDWGMGVIACGAAGMSFIMIMFKDNPKFGSNFNAIQKLAFVYQGYIIGFIFLVFIGSFIFQFFIKNIPWHHIVGVASIFVLVWFYVFFNAYSL